MKAFKLHPIAFLLTYATVALGALTALQATGTLHGKAAAWVDGAVGFLNLIVGMYARMHVTPLARPRDANGRRMITQPPAPGNYQQDR